MLLIEYTSGFDFGLGHRFEMNKKVAINWQINIYGMITRQKKYPVICAEILKFSQKSRKFPVFP